MVFIKQNWAYFFLAFVAFVLYANTLGHNFALDDYSVISENRIVKKGSDAIGEIFTTHYRAGYWAKGGNLYRPLPLSMFAIEYEWFAGRAAGYHLVNVLLYVLLTLLLYGLLQKWLIRQHPLLPFAVTLLFVLHPIHTEVVANIKSRDELMAFIFMLGLFHTLHLFLRKQNKPAFFVALICYLLALFSKESSVSMIGIIPLVLYFFYNKKLKSATLLTLPFIIPLLVFLIARNHALTSLAAQSGDGSWLMAQPDPFSKLASSIRYMGLYLYKMIIPYPLVSDYSYPQFKNVSWASWPVLSSLLVYGAGIWIAVKGWKNREIWSFAILFFLITHFLHSNLLLMIGTIFGERLLFTPSLGVILLMGLGLSYWWKRDTNTTSGISTALKSTRVALPLLLISLIYGWLTVQRNQEWFNNRTLYTADVKKHPDSPLLNYWYGLEQIDSDWLKQLGPVERTASINTGIRAFEKAAKLKKNYGDAVAQLGLSYYKLNQYDKALSYFEEALGMGEGSVETLNNTAAIYFAKGNYLKAKEYYERAVGIDPYYIDAIGNLGATYGALKEFERALVYFDRALNLNPDNASYLYYKAITLNQLGRMEEAQPYFKRAFELNPALQPK